jgi:hypothetical protein
MCSPHNFQLVVGMCRGHWTGGGDASTCKIRFFAEGRSRCHSNLKTSKCIQQMYRTSTSRVKEYRKGTDKAYFMVVVLLLLLLLAIFTMTKFIIGKQRFSKLILSPFIRHFRFSTYINHRN